MELIARYFPELTQEQLHRLQVFQDRMVFWNERVNLVSRKDIANLEERHILHSLAIARYIHFAESASVLDLGTGGGFPGIPLAIRFPGTQFLLIDARAKKIRAVADMVGTLALGNVRCAHVRAEELEGAFDFVVTRAVASLEQIRKWSRGLIHDRQKHFLPNGIIALKGGDPDAELKALPRSRKVEVRPVRDYFDLPFFEEKYLIHLKSPS